MVPVHTLNAVNRVEILTLADNYIDLAALDNSEIVTRGTPVIQDTGLRNSFLAEHGFSAVIKCFEREVSRTMIFDFGLTKDVVVRNADTSGYDLSEVESATLSHGHIDHFGGLAEVVKRIGKTGIELIVHPSVFRANRYVLPYRDFNVPLIRQQVEELGFSVIETREPCLMLNGEALFLGEIARKTSFEKGMPNAFYELDGQEIWDPLEDDTGIAMSLSGRGLIVLSGCSHSGTINIVEQARKVTGIDKVHAIIGGFHLSGPAYEPIIDDTINAMKEINPEYVIPTHSTGRKATSALEKAMPGKFILNMVGTKLTFTA